MAEEYKSAREELTAIVSKMDNFRLAYFLTPDEAEKVRERVIEQFQEFYKPMLEKIEPKYHVGFIRFTQTGEASPEFMAYIDDERNIGAQEALDIAHRKTIERLEDLALALRQDHRTKK